VDTIQITENELFEIIGRQQVELYAKDKELAAFRGQFEKSKPTLVEAEVNKAKNVALEVSNKSLAEKNIQLDQALTEARKQCEAIRGEWTKGNIELSHATERMNDAEKNVAILNQTVEDLRKQLASVILSPKKPKK